MITTPQFGDSVNLLLQRIVALRGGDPLPCDSDTILYRKWAVAEGSAPAFSDNNVHALRKVAGARSVVWDPSDSLNSLLRKISGGLPGHSNWDYLHLFLTQNAAPAGDVRLQRGFKLVRPPGITDPWTLFVQSSSGAVAYGTLAENNPSEASGWITVPGGSELYVWPVRGGGYPIDVPYGEITAVAASNINVTEIDVSHCLSLQILECGGNEGVGTCLTSLTLPATSSLTEVRCSGNLLVSLDVSQVPNLRVLECSNNSFGANGFLDVSGRTFLEVLTFRACGVASVNLTGCSSLTYLDCPHNALLTLEVAGAPALTYLDCSDNQLETLDVSSNVLLTEFTCSLNGLTSLNVAGCPSLSLFEASGNLLASISLANNPVLGYADLSSNLLPEAVVDTVLSDLAGFSVNSGDLSLGGTGNSSPSVAGLASKAVLESVPRVWTVTTN